MIVRMCDNLIYELSKNQSKMLQQTGEFIDEIVLCGGYLIDEIREKDSYVYNHNTRIILMIIGNVLEKLDSVGVLLKNGCTEGLIPIQRTIVEMYFSIMFIFKDDFEEKIIAYDVCHINERILSGAVLKKKANLIELKKIEDKVKKLEKMLGQDEYRKLNCIWEKLYNRKKYPPEWYQIISDKCWSVKGIVKKNQ